MTSKLAKNANGRLGPSLDWFGGSEDGCEFVGGKFPDPIKDTGHACHLCTGQRL